MHLQPILYFRERITELSEQAKFGPSHTILPHIKVAHCFEIRKAIEGRDQLLVRPDPLQHLLAIFLRIVRYTLVVIQFDGNLKASWSVAGCSTSRTERYFSNAPSS